jgi:hypothetical protein
MAQSEFSPNSVYTFDRQRPLTRSARDTRPTNIPAPRSKTPGPELDATISSSYHSNTMKPRSKTPIPNEFSSNNLHNRFETKFYSTF